MEQLRNQIVILEAGRILFEIGGESNDLEKEGINRENVQRLLNVERTKLELLMSEFRRKEKDSVRNDEINFWESIASVERGIGRSLDVEKVTVAHWLAIIKDLRDHYSELNKNGRRQNTHK